MPCPPRLEELCVWGIPYFREAALIPHIPSLRTLQLHCQKESLDITRLAAMAALRSLCVTTSGGFAAIGEAVPALTRLTRLSFKPEWTMHFTDSSSSDSAAQRARAELSLVLQKLSVLASLRCLSLSGMAQGYTLALDCTAAFSSLEELYLEYCTVDANDGLLRFLGRQSRLANVQVDDMVFVGNKPAMSAYRASMARCIPAYLSVSVDRWSCREAMRVNRSLVSTWSVSKPPCNTHGNLSYATPVCTKCRRWQPHRLCCEFSSASCSSRRAS